MKDLYAVAGISKQALHTYIGRKEYILKVTSQVLNHCNTIRKNHKRMGCRRMYWAVKEELPVGRDLFEQIGFANGFKLKIKRSQVKTTWASKLQVCPNLIEGKVLTDINQVWQADFFYLKVGNKDYYGVTIIDVYSRKLLALHVSERLTSKELIKAFCQALKSRKGMVLKNCIFHSDRGTQFFAQDFKTILKEYQFKQSMCTIAQENAYVERVQGTIKYEYLFEIPLTSANLQKQMLRTKYLYNYERPHSQLKQQSPMSFENTLRQQTTNNHPELIIYKWEHPLLTKFPLINKEKRSKKETTTLIS